jgi:transcriptional regulator with XRE-family HTH domain
VNPSSDGRTPNLVDPAHDAEVDRAYLSRVERAVTYVGLEIIESLATILEVDPAEFFQRPSRPESRKKAE